MTGPSAAPIVVVPYDPDWPRRFELESASLEGLLAPWLEGGIHHVGSTAIPGLAAKPVIDMIAGVRSLEEAGAATAPLGEAGWEHSPHRPRTRHFHRPPGPPWSARFSLHLTEPGSDLWRERLAFRDALRADPALAAEYEQLKLSLAVGGSGPGGYTVSKRPFVARVLAARGIELPPESPR